MQTHFPIVIRIVDNNLMGSRSAYQSCHLISHPSDLPTGVAFIIIATDVHQKGDGT